MIDDQPQSRHECSHAHHRHIPFLLFQLARQLGNVIERRVAPFDITAQQAALLTHSCSLNQAHPSQLASWLGTDNAGITRLVDRLETRGLAERRSSPTDRRAILIEPTDAGRALVPRLKIVFEGAHAQLLEGLSPAEVETLHSLLHRALQNVGVDDLPGEIAQPETAVAAGASTGAQQ